MLWFTQEELEQLKTLLENHTYHRPLTDNTNDTPWDWTPIDPNEPQDFFIV